MRGMVTQATHDELQQRMIFLHSNRAPKDSPFLAEFEALATKNKNFSYVPTMTHLEGQLWNGEQGYITIDMLKKYVENITIPIYYLSGPGSMVGAMQRMLMLAGVSNYNIRLDQYVGY